MCYFFKTDILYLKAGDLLSTFQKKQKNEFICVKRVITLIFCNEEAHFLDFLSKILINHYLIINSQKRVF